MDIQGLLAENPAAQPGRRVHLYVWPNILLLSGLPFAIKKHVLVRPVPFQFVHGSLHGHSLRGFLQRFIIPRPLRIE